MNATAAATSPQAAASLGSRASSGKKNLSLLAQMREDAEAAFERDPAADSVLDIALFSTGTHIVWAYRRNHWLWTHGAHRLALLLAKRTRRRLAADIHPAATIGRRFTIDHGVGVVIGGTAVIGDDCLLYQGVTLGMTGKHGGKSHPTLGSGVLVGANATILGNIRVGDNARVGAGSVVVDNVPSDVTVVGVPARIVRDRRYRGPHLVGKADEFVGSAHSLARGDGSGGAGDAADSPANGLVHELSRLDQENLLWSCAL